MALRIVCDGGCGFSSADPSEMEERGFVIRHHYCPACVASIDEYLLQRDLLHDRLADEWARGLLNLQEALRPEGGVLPDE